MAFYATFDAASYYGSCPNRGCAAAAGKSPSSPSSKILSFCRQAECICSDTSFGGVFGLQDLEGDSNETLTKARGWLSQLPR
jgi:hypothetical protein